MINPNFYMYERASTKLSLAIMLHLSSLSFITSNTFNVKPETILTKLFGRDFYDLKMKEQPLELYLLYNTLFLLGKEVRCVHGNTLKYADKSLQLEKNTSSNL
jgi:hypothetical protein